VDSDFIPILTVEQSRPCHRKTDGCSCRLCASVHCGASVAWRPKLCGPHMVLPG